MIKSFQVEIKEELSRVVHIEAENPDEAIDKARFLYKTKEIMLDASDFTKEAEFSLLSSKDKTINQPEVVSHIAKILSYLEVDEQRDYEQSQYPKNHIYHCIAYLNQYIETI
ncbi:DpnD/PcfM family protein [Neisseria sp. 83E34]|uniref:DpnD/PcfM family protein n=1 Tax=Neisseria sp. 83E34 TaxID=1692264 RepID=UPI0006CE9E73|nr:DpnD/PcfM family protein [Neisseria sp. 83E34]KPN71329.1 hypothetical protein AKG09_07690 [Neisseria sp. 83E34]